MLVCAGCRERLDAEINGHRVVTIEQGERVATFDPDRLPVIRIPGPRANFEVELDDQTIAFDHRYEDGANFLHVPPTDALGDVELEVRADSGARASFNVRFMLRPEQLPEIEPIVRAREQKDFDRAMALAEEALRSRTPLIRAYAAIERGRIAQRRGDHLEASRLWREGSEIARASGVISQVAARLDAAAFAARAARRFALAEELLQLAERAGRESGDLENRFTLLAERAALASDLGDQRRALADLQDAADVARRLGIQRSRWISEQALGNYLFQLGRFGDALAVYPDPEKIPHLDEDLRASFDVNLAIIEIRGIQAGMIERSFDAPKRRIERAAALLSSQPYRLANALCVLARAELASGDAARAGATIRRAATTHERIFHEDVHDCSFVEIEIQLASGRIDEAGRVLAELESRLSQGTIADELAIIPLWLRARIARARGQPDAVDRYLAAFEVAVAMARETPIRQDRAGFVAGRTTTVDELIDLLVERKDLASAFSIADSARALILADLDAEVRLARLDEPSKNEWAQRLELYHSLRDDLPRLRAECERLHSREVPQCTIRLEERRREIAALLDRAFELLDRKAPASPVSQISTQDVIRALGDRAAIILVHGRGSGMRSFLIDGTGVQHERGPPPLDRWMVNIDRLYVVGDWDPIAADARLAARVAIAMLPSARFLLEAKPLPTGRPLIAGDPNGDLPGARREAEAIASNAIRLMGAAATRRAILSQVDGAAFFHFAGHAQVVGESPSHTSLRVADGAITLEDLLMARPKVGVVVLSACSSGSEATRGAVGLPHAFLISGARAVLATTRPLQDAKASQFLLRFYERGGPDRPLLAFREAIEASVAAGDTTWNDFRLFGR